MRDGPQHLTSGELATALGMGKSTLLRAWRDGRITPEIVTPGGYPRWDLDRVRGQLMGQPAA